MATRQIHYYFVQALYYHLVGNDKRASENVLCALTWTYPIAQMMERAYQ